MLRTYKISTKILLTYMIACLIPILLVTWYLMTNLANFTVENTRLLAEANYEQLQSSLAAGTESATNILNTLISDPELTDYLTTDFTSDYDALVGYLNVLERRVSSLVSDQFQILIYSANPTIGISRMTNNTMEDFYGRYGPEAALNRTEITSLPVLGQGASPDTLGFYKVLTNLNSPKHEKIIYSVEIPVDLLLAVPKSGEASARLAYLFDSSGALVAATEEGRAERTLGGMGLRGVAKPADLKGIESLSLHGTKYCAFYGNVQQNFQATQPSMPDWHLLYLVPYSYLQANLTKMMLSCVVVVLLCVCTSFLLASGMTKSITGRLSVLGRKMKDVINGNFKVMAPICVPDEIGTLEGNFYEMVGYLSGMIDDIYANNREMVAQKLRLQKIQQEKTEAQLIALQRQINPHYLFNTLESIRMHLIIKGDRDTAHIIKLFSVSFRSMLEREHEAYTLQEELDFVSNYIAVQQYRMEHKFTYEVRVSPALCRCFVPKLTLQPLVENAVYHGIEEKLGTGRVEVDIRREGGCLVLSVRDDGPGIPPEVLRELGPALRGEATKSKRFLALRNIWARVSLLSGDKSCLTLENLPQGGVLAKLRLPYDGREQEGAEEEQEDAESFDCR